LREVIVVIVAWGLGAFLDLPSVAIVDGAS